MGSLEWGWLEMQVCVACPLKGVGLCCMGGGNRGGGASLIQRRCAQLEAVGAAFVVFD